MYLLTFCTVPCIRILTDGYGEISTPNYPSAYTLGDCVWYLDVLDGIAKLAANRVPSGSYSSSCATAQLEVRLMNWYHTSDLAKIKLMEAKKI